MAERNKIIDDSSGFVENTVKYYIDGTLGRSSYMAELANQSIDEHIEALKKQGLTQEDIDKLVVAGIEKGIKNVFKPR